MQRCPFYDQRVRPPGQTTDVVITLSADYAGLVLYASKLGASAQTLRCTITGGGGPPYGVVIEVTSSGGATAIYHLTTDASGNCTFGPAQAADPDFGTTAVGQWTGRAFSGGSPSNSVVWFVSWFSVHERP